MKKLSIIVPIYNVELYLRECVESLLSQNYENFEIILVNDGSTDACGEICDYFSSNYSNVKVIHQENQGLPFARNAGLDIADGEYIGFIDSDDKIDPDMYVRLINELEKNDADMAICNFELYNKKGIHAISSRYGNEVIVYSNENTIPFYKCAIDSSCNKVYRHDIIKNNELLFEDKKIVAQEDFWFLIRYCSHISKIVTISDALYKYRERRSSISKSRSDKDITDRCIKFISLTSEFMNSVGRTSQAFLETLTLEMLSASINQLSMPSSKEIRRIIRSFEYSKHYNPSRLKQETYQRGIRGLYTSLTAMLLRHRFYLPYSLVEAVRVRRLHSKTKVDEQFP